MEIFVRIWEKWLKYNFGFFKIKALKKICLTKVNEHITYFCWMRKQYLFLPALFAFFIISCNNTDAPAPDPDKTSVPILTYNIVSTLSHDTSYFTEGLEFYDSTLLESTGNYGKSKLVQYEPKTKQILKELKLDNKYFAEGITVLKDTLYQLTYKEEVVLVYDAKTFKKIGELPFKGEGWGLTNDGKNLIASNGSNNLYYYEPGTFKLLKTLNVTENGTPVVNINELEYVDGFVYANQWQYGYIVKIDASNGNVVARLDFNSLVDAVRKDKHSEYFNGIAYNKNTKKFYVTGKLWPQIYEIQF